MKWMSNLLALYMIMIVSLCVLISLGKVEFDEYQTSLFTLSEEASNYALDQQLIDVIADPTKAFVYENQLQLIDLGEEGYVPPISVNPYLFERNWGYHTSLAKDPQIDITSSLWKDNQNNYFIIAEYEMPITELFETQGTNFLQIGYSDEYLYSNLYHELFVEYEGTFTQLDVFWGEFNDSKMISFPHLDKINLTVPLTVTGFVAIEIPVGEEVDYFQSSVSIYDGVEASSHTGVLIGFNTLHLESYYMTYYISATWVEYRKDV